ncbi:MAG: hypothetical protein L3K19_00065 [Thermoplasmata archaeon]|nr:hypothetical protein [Thermoplasmata archaeon]
MGSASSSVGPIDREACRFLRLQVEPTLEPSHEAPLLKVVREAVEATDLSLLQRLSERQRRRLLTAMEERLTGARPAPSPRALVRLTSALSSGATPEEGFGRQLAPPAR